MNHGRLVLVEWEGRRRSRRDVILELEAAGVPVAEIARRLGVRYQIVYTTLHSQPAVRPIPAVPSAAPQVPGPAGSPDAILLGCVSQKNTSPMAARDLYRSELFRRRRRYAEASGRPWWIVSVEYGLVDPDRVIAPYDTRIARLPLAARHELADRVAADLERALGTLAGTRLEIHAGDEYVLAIGPSLRDRGARLTRPLEGLRIGEQLAWYGERLGLPSGAVTSPRAPTVIRSDPTAVGDGRGLGRRLSELFMAGRLDLSARPGAPASGWEGMPEVVAVHELQAFGASAEAVRRFLTFCAAMDRARDADRLAVAAVRLYRDEPWTFEPQAVVARPLRELADALRRDGVSQRHVIDAFGWRILAETLADPSLAPGVHTVVFEGRGEAAVLLAELARTSSGGTPLFPLLGGPKVGPLWVRLLAYPGGAEITSLDRVPVAVDVQVRKVTEYLGVTETAGLDLEDVRATIQETWARDVAAHGAAGPGGLADTPGALDPALWFYGKWGCTFCQRAGEKMPISPLCAECWFGDS
jgi:hypothetical protein